eukprot:GHVN01080407.1.p1 GENE.GHVN01080407.1~~GHVN01080407.1.p1  ORF type:complete len:133 (-),score=11.12 GHVN01080407.1:494-892(-)
MKQDAATATRVPTPMTAVAFAAPVQKQRGLALAAVHPRRANVATAQPCPHPLCQSQLATDQTSPHPWRSRWEAVVHSKPGQYDPPKGAHGRALTDLMAEGTTFLAQGSTLLKEPHLHAHLEWGHRRVLVGSP